jgi:heme/copper-type cytochrome/quinol oxidase subunit 2
MKSKLLLPQDHPSYQLHRKQMWTQILLPILLAVLVFIAVIVLTSVATFRNNGDVGRWAAISTIWLVLPVLIVGLLFLIILLAIIYLLARLISLIPPYSYQAQRFIYRIEGYVKRGTEMIVKPVLFVDIIKSQINKFMGRR